MISVVRRICTKRLIEKLFLNRPNTNFSTIGSHSSVVEPLCNHIFQTNLHIYRHKSKNKNKSKKQDSGDESDETDKDFLDEIPDKNTKTLKVNVASMRLDVLLKAGLGLSRNKLETIFYESKIRLNGEKVLKKSVHVAEGDEIDIIKGSNISNTDFLKVARVEILSALGKDENISVKMRRCKALTIDNYEGKNRWGE